MPPTFIEYDPSSVVAQELWPLDKIKNDPLEVRVRDEEVREYPEGQVVRREIFFTSHEFRGEKIRVAAHVALPQGKGPLPVMVQGAGNLDGADSFSRAHNIATVSIDRVGTGDSNGPGDLYNESWLDLGHDPRDGWMYQFVYNVLRAITYMQAQPEVDGSRVAVSGGSRGGTMSLIANGVDPRITLAIPTATCGDILTAFEHDGWANHLYREEDGEIGIPPKFRIFSIYGDPINLANSQHGKVMLILGAQDEFFPIYTVKSYCSAFTGELRLCLVQDWDHGLFSADRPEVDTYDNREEAGKRTAAATRYAIECYLHQKRSMPLTPRLSWLFRNGKIEFTCTPDSSWPLEHVHLIYSRDGAYFFKRMPMEKIYDTFKERYVVSLPSTFEQAAKLAFYVEAKYEDGPYLMSPPEFGLAFQQRMRQHAPRPPAPEPQFLTEEVVYGDGCEACVSYDKTRKELPILVLLGPPEGDRLEVNDEALKAEAQRFSHRGLFVVAARARSSLDLTFLLENLQRSYADHLRQDAISLIGYSQSGALALQSAVEAPERFRCVVAYSPCASAHQMAPANRAAGNLHATQVRIFADLEDPSLFTGQSFTDAARAAGLRNVSLACSHPSDGLRWSLGWPAENPALRRAEERFVNLLTVGDGPKLAVEGAGQLVVAPRLSTSLFDIVCDSDSSPVVAEYSILDDQLSLRIQPAGSGEDTACTVYLRDVTEVEHNGERVEVDADGTTQVTASAGSVLTAKRP